MSRKVQQAVLCLMLVATAAFAQTGATTGQIAGTVTDNTGAALPGVTVTARNVETGLTRTQVTDERGRYTLTLLPPGRYHVEGELAGLGSAARQVTVLLGTTAGVDLSIAPQLAEEITITAAAPVVDTTEAGLTTSVTTNEIENLPILGRDFRDLALLTPGVTTTFGERVTASGARGISTDYNIDGADTNSDFFGEQRGGTRAPFTFSQAAIQEFQVIRSTYSAEYAKGVGATLNAITKSGTNEVTGQVFFYQRQADWASDRPDSFRGEDISDSFEARDVDQYGAAVGGPIIRDRLFYFLNADFQDFSRGVNVFDWRQSSAFQSLDPAVQAQFIQRVEQAIGRSLDEEFTFSQTEDQKVYLVKFDWSLADNHRLSLRDNYSNFTNFGSEGTRPLSNNGQFDNTFNTLVGQLESILGPNMFNQLIVQSSKEERPREPLNTSSPQVFVGGGVNANFGQREFLPNDLVEDRLQIKENLSWVLGNHNVKAGFEYIQTDLDNLFPRNFAGNYQFNSVQDFLDNRPSSFRQGLGRPEAPMGNNVFDYDYWGIFIHDNFDLTDRLNVDAGLRYDAQSMPRPIDNIFPQYPEFLENFDDKSNVAPRVGFAYDIYGDGRSVLRGGAGLFYNYLPSILLADPLAQIGGLYNQININCSRNPCPQYPSLLSRPEFEAAAQSSSFIRIVSDELDAQESLKTSLGWEHQLGASYSVGIEASYAKLDNQQRLVNINARPSGIRYGNLTIYNVTDPNRPYPDFGDVQAHISDAEAEYTALTLSTRKIAVGGSNLSWMAHYTWSESIDQDSNERSTSTAFSYDPFDPELSEGPSDYDVEHKVVLSGTYEAPFGIIVSGIFNWRTGQPFTRGVSGIDNGLFGLGVDVPVFVDSNGNVVDLTQATGMSREQLMEFLAGTTMEGRNRQRQPDFHNLDLRVAKRFAFGGGLGVELIAEIFNALNTKNRVVPTNNQRLFFGSFRNGVWTFTRNPNYGLENAYAFGSDPRQYQLAVKFLF